MAHFLTYLLLIRALAIFFLESKNNRDRIEGIAANSCNETRLSTSSGNHRSFRVRLNFPADSVTASIAESIVDER